MTRHHAHPAEARPQQFDDVGAGTRGGEAHRLAGAYAGGSTVVVGGAGLALQARIQRRLAASANA